MAVWARGSQVPERTVDPVHEPERKVETDTENRQHQSFLGTGAGSPTSHQQNPETIQCPSMDAALVHTMQARLAEVPVMRFGPVAKTSRVQCHG